MASTKTIYISDEAEATLNKIKIEQPYFNFSAWISDRLLELNSSPSQRELEKLQMDVNNKELQIKQIEGEVVFLKERIAKYEAMQEIISKQEKEKSDWKAKNEEYTLNSIADSFMEFFEDIDLTMGKELAKEYFYKPDKTTIWKFASERGLKLKHDKEKENQ